MNAQYLPQGAKLEAEVKIEQAKPIVNMHLKKPCSLKLRQSKPIKKPVNSDLRHEKVRKYLFKKHNKDSTRRHRYTSRQ